MNVTLRKYRIWLINPDSSISLINAGMHNDWVEAASPGDAVRALVERHPSIYSDDKAFYVEIEHSRHMRYVEITGRERVTTTRVTVNEVR